MISIYFSISDGHICDLKKETWLKDRGQRYEKIQTVPDPYLDPCSMAVYSDMVATQTMQINST